MGLEGITARSHGGVGYCYQRWHCGSWSLANATAIPSLHTTMPSLMTCVPKAWETTL